MTPLEVINEVIDDFERPDLFEVAERKFPQCLVSAHSVDSFARDLKEEIYPYNELLINNSAATIIPPDGFRKVWRLFTQTDSGNIVDKQFLDQTALISLRDYFGYRIPQTFNRFGNKLNVTGLSVNANNLHLHYLSFPVITVDTNGQMQADSWILQEFPQLVVAYLKYAVAPILQQESEVAAAQQQVLTYRREILSIYVEELLGEPETWPVH